MEKETTDIKVLRRETRVSAEIGGVRLTATVVNSGGSLIFESGMAVREPASASFSVSGEVMSVSYVMCGAEERREIAEAIDGFTEAVRAGKEGLGL